MMETKIQLSTAEMNLMCNAEIILTKNVVIEKTKLLLETVQDEMMQYVQTSGLQALNDIFEIPPKISKGENYKGLPYLVLDYPRVFRQHETFAIRTFFWWGHFFSSTWQVSGSFKNPILPKLVKAHAILAPHHFTGISSDPWQHHFEEDNYLPIGTLSQIAFETHLIEQEPIKIAAKYPLSDWHSAATLLFKNWKLYIDIYKS
jgi:hypothetical protein